MRVVLERLGLELVVPPIALGTKRTRLDTSHASGIEELLMQGIDPDDGDSLRALLASLEPSAVEDLPDWRVVSVLLDHIRWGRVGVFELEQLSASVAEEEEKEEHQPEVKTRHWIEIQLVDETGAPVSGQAYRITLPDGEVRQGSTDGKGVVRFDGIDPGQCDFTFTKLDQEAWEPA